MTQNAPRTDYFDAKVIIIIIIIIIIIVIGFEIKNANVQIVKYRQCQK